MEIERHLRSEALARMAVGGSLLAAPALAARSWIGIEAHRPATKVVVRAMGVRDLVLGLGLFRALDRGESPRPWVEYGAASDAVDALATLLAFRHLPRWRRFGVLVAAGGTAAFGAWALSQLD